MPMTGRRPLETELARIKRETQHAPLAAAADRATTILHHTGITNDALRAGEIAPDFELDDAKRRCYSLADQINHGVAVITFIHGGWSAYCRANLAALTQAHSRITDRGASLLVISLESISQNQRLAETLGLTFPILSDPGGRVSRLFGVLYHVPAELVAAYLEQDIDLPSRQHSDRWVLPLAAAYVIDKNGVVRFAFANADPSLRAEPSDLIGAIDAITARR